MGNKDTVPCPSQNTLPSDIHDAMLRKKILRKQHIYVSTKRRITILVCF
uniref:Uncharacterized protein n=1 Tax=Arundo donax TaxID=35708 RepID=A0A0A9CPB8_ARUDO